ncbi:sensor histidine kinase [Cryomorphaceae bacterium 1068]|nr:sensor histidine kinase [Cryomorphaceae bacterium 1068]
MKRVFLFCLIISLNSLYAQVDSLDQKLIGLKNQALVDKLNELSFTIAQSDPNRAKEMAEEAAEKSVELKYAYGSADAMHKLSVAYRFQGYYNEALLYADSALGYLDGTEAVSLKAAIHSNKGVCYRYKGEYEEALKSYQKAIDLHKEANQNTDVGTVLNNVGVMFMYMEDYDKALSYYDEALDIQTEENNRKEIANIYNNYAIVYANQGVLDSALTYFERSYGIEKELNNLQGMSESINNIGAVYYYMGDMESAIDQFRESYRIDSTLGDIRGQISTLSNIAEMKNEMGNPRQAIQTLEKCLRMANEIDSKHDREISLANLASSYKNLGNFEKALEYHVQYLAVHDSVLGENQQEIVQELETQYQTKEKEQQIKIQGLELEEADLKIQARNNMLLGLSGILLLALVSGILGYRFIKSKKEAELQRAIAAEQKNQLDAVINATEQEKRRMARELHDGIGQQLSSIKLGLANMSNQMKDQGEENQTKFQLIEKVVDESAQDVRELSHRMMPKSLSELGLGAAIKDSLEKSLGLNNIRYHFHDDTEGNRFADQVEVNMYRVSQELINNILKHSGADRVSIDLLKENETLVLAVKDNGKGFNPTKDEGHGLLNIKSRLQQINASLSFDFPEEGGTETTIKTPLS